MGLLKWDDSPHFKKPRLAIDADVDFIEPELPTLLFPHTAKQIAEAIQDDPRYNAINPSNQAAIIDFALAHAKKSGMLREENEDM